MDELSYRNIWISLAIVMSIAAVGVFLLRHAEQARGIFELVLFVGGILLLQTLDHRELRRKGLVGRGKHGHQ